MNDLQWAQTLVAEAKALQDRNPTEALVLLDVADKALQRLDAQARPGVGSQQRGGAGSSAEQWREQALARLRSKVAVRGRGERMAANPARIEVTQLPNGWTRFRDTTHYLGGR